MMEEFEHEGHRVRQIFGHPDYFVSDIGTVYSAKGKNRQKWRDDPSVLRKLRPSAGWDGYKGLILCTGGIRHWLTIHRLVLLAFRGPCPEGGQCRHLDGSRQNNDINNLWWGTVKENMADKFRHRTMPRGEQLNRGVLTDRMVREIRSRYAAGGISLAALGEEYGISASHVCQVVHRKLWKHVE